MLNRIITIDVLRGIGIILVAIQHVFIKALPDNFWQYLNFNVGSSFNMTLFITIGGYLAYYSLSKHSDHIQWIKNKAYYLLLPHFAINILVYPMSRTGIAEWNNLSQGFTFPEWLLHSTFYGQGEWFLYVLFFCLSLLVALRYMKDRTPSRYYPFILLAITLAFIWFPFRMGEALWVDRIQFYFPFALGGYLIAEHKEIIAKYLNLPRFALLAVCGLGLYIYMLYLSNWNGGWGSSPFVNLFLNSSWTALRFGQGIASLPVILFIGYGISHIKYLSNLLAWLGKLTLGLYMSNLLFTLVGFGSGWILVWTSVAMTLLIGLTLTLLSKKFVFRKVNKYFIPQATA